MVETFLLTQTIVVITTFPNQDTVKTVVKTLHPKITMMKTMVHPLKMRIFIKVTINLKVKTALKILNIPLTHTVMVMPITFPLEITIMT